MATYLLVYHGGGMPETEEEGKRVLAAWGKWFEELGDAVIDGGNPIGRTQTIDGHGHIADGGGANPATGYSLLKGDSLEAAVQMAKGCPLLTSGGSVEVCETFNAM